MKLKAKLQKHDQDVYEAFKMVTGVIERLQTIRSNIDTTFEEWYKEILKFADAIGVSESVPRKTSLQRNRSNIPSSSPKEHYKRIVAIPLVDSLMSQLNDRFRGETGHTKALLFLIPSVMRSSTFQLSDYLDDFHYWNADLPCSKSLPSELRRWHALWNESGTSENINNLVLTLGSCDVDSFPNIHRLLLIACTLPITSAKNILSFTKD